MRINGLVYGIGNPVTIKLINSNSIIVKIKVNGKIPVMLFWLFYYKNNSKIDNKKIIIFLPLCFKPVKFLVSELFPRSFLWKCNNTTI